MVAENPPRVEIIETVDEDGGINLELRVNGLRLATARATAEVIEAMGMDRAAVRSELEKALTNLPVAPELANQVFGYWFGPGEKIPARPVGAPTGAILIRPPATIADTEFVCLDLVPVQNTWLVLSELGRYTYRHTSGLLLGTEEWRFVPVTSAPETWPVILIAHFADSLSSAQVAAQYGADAAVRTRHDAPAVQLRLKRA